MVTWCILSPDRKPSSRGLSKVAATNSPFSTAWHSIKQKGRSICKMDTGRKVVRGKRKEWVQAKS